ncbi:MotA/TolQ/ExbB proton channel family protein, partial [Bartonella bacilliformis]
MGPDVAPLLESNFPSFAAHDFSPLAMFMAADFVVKAVMVLLILASIVSWTIAFAKIVEITLAKRKAQRALRSAQQAQTLACLVDQLQNQTGASVLFLQETLREISLSTQQGVSLSAQQNVASSMQQGVAVQKGVPLSTTQQSAAGSEEAESNNNPDILSGMLHEGVKERVHSLLSRYLLVATQRMAAGNAILATIGAISPFVGLFATVWGIMNSFIGIAKTQTTRLDVVAPGIAEALLA